MSDDIKTLHGVLYTDGGFKPTHVIGGWGFHGYLYHAVECKTGSGAKGFTPGPKGYLKGNLLPMPITPIEYVDGLGSITVGATNNVAELQGAIRALTFVLERKLTTVHVLMDSQYVLKGFNEWLDRWEAAGWIKGDRQPVANMDLWKRLLELKRAIAEAGIELTTEWVKGHNTEWFDSKDPDKQQGEPGNDAADRLCNRACQAAINGAEIDKVIATAAKGYWRVKIERNRMLNLSTLLYLGQLGQTRGEGEMARYHMTHLRTNDDFLRQALQGKPMSDTQCAVVMLNTPDPVLDVLMDLHNQFAVQTRRTPIIKFDINTITKPEIYNTIASTGADFMLIDAQRHHVATLDKTPLSTALEPPRLAFHALDTLEHLGQLLDTYMTKDHAKLVTPETPVRSNPTLVLYTEITDQLYGMVEKGKKSIRKLKEAVTGTTRALTFEVLYRTDTLVEANKADVSLSLALDLPDRNMLSAMADTIVKVVVVTWPESRHAFRYATIIETTEGLGIWAAPYANLHFVSPSP